MSARIYVGNLPMDVRERDLDDLFYKYGRIRGIDIKRPSRPPAYAFVAFEDYRDAKDAIYGRDGYDFDGGRIRVEPANEMRRDDRGRGGDRRGPGGRGGGRGRTDYKVEVLDLPSGTSWQDLKDFFKTIGDVLYADVNRDSGVGVIEFAQKDDMKHALKKMDGADFNGKEIRVELPRDSRYRDESPGAGGGGDARSRSRSPAKKRRDSRSPSRDREEEGGKRKESVGSEGGGGGGGGEGGEEEKMKKEEEDN